MTNIVDIPSSPCSVKIEKSNRFYIYSLRKDENYEWEVYRTKKAPLEIDHNKDDVGVALFKLLTYRSDYTDFKWDEYNKAILVNFNSLMNELNKILDNNLKMADDEEVDLTDKYQKLYSRYLVKKEKYNYSDLQFLAQICQGLGVGLSDTILKIYISYLLTVLKIKATNVIVIGSQSSGKSFSIESALKMIPSEYVVMGVHTEAYFFGKFNGKNLDRFIFYLGDLGGVHDDEKTIITRDILKQLNTDGYVERGIAPDSEPREEYVEGNPAITYSTVEETIINEQEKSRSNIVKPPNIPLEKLTLFNAFYDSPGIDYQIIEMIEKDTESVKGLTWNLMQNINNYELFNPYMFCIADFLQNMDDYNRKIKEFNKILLIVSILNNPFILEHEIYFDKESHEQIVTKLLIASKQDIINALDIFDSSNNLLPTEFDLLITLCKKYEPFEDVDNDTTIKEYENLVINEVTEDGILQYEFYPECFFTVSSIRRDYGNLKQIKDVKNSLSGKLRKLYENNYIIKIGNNTRNENIYGLIYDIKDRIENNIPIFRDNEINLATNEFNRKYPMLKENYQSFIYLDKDLDIKEKNYNVETCEIYDIPWDI